MATTYGILIEMQANVARLQRDMAESKRIVGDFAGSAIRSFKALGGVIGLAFSAETAFNISKWLVGLVKSIDDLEEVAQGVGTTAVALAEMREAARFAGVDSQKLDQALARLAGRMDDAVAGNKDAIFAFKQLGITIKDASGNLLSTDAVLAQIADRFSTFKDSTEKAAAAGVLFGDKLGKTLVPFLNQGSEGIRRYVGLSEELVKKNLEAEKSLEELAAFWTKVKFSVAGVAAEIINFFSLLGENKRTLNNTVESIRFHISTLERELRDVGHGGLLERLIFGDPETRRQRIEKQLRALQAELKDALERPGLERFISGAVALRREEQEAMPSLQRSKEAESFLEKLKNQVRQLEFSEERLLRIEAAEKNVSKEAEVWIRKLEEAKQKLKDLEELERSISAQERIRAQTAKAIGKGVDLFSKIKIETEELDFSDFQKRLADIEREFSVMRAEISLSGLTGEDLQSALDQVDAWRLAVVRAVEEWNAKLENVHATLRELNAIEERITAEEKARRSATEVLGKASGIFTRIKQETEFSRLTEFGRNQARIKQEFSELRAEIAASGLTGEELDKALSELDEWHSATMDALREQRNELISWSAGWDSAMREFIESTKDGAAQAKEAFETMTKGFENLLMDFIQTGRLNIIKFLQDIAAMLLRNRMRELIGRFLEFVGGSSISGKQFGGSVTAFQPILVGEKGPELFVPASNGIIVPNDRIRTVGAPSVVINQNITVDSRSDRAVIFAAMEENRQRTIATVSEMLRRRSPVFSG